MRKTFWCAAVLGGGLLAGAAALHAAPPHGDHGNGHWHAHMAKLHGDGHAPCGLLEKLHGHFEQFAALHEELELTDAQLQAMRKTLQARHADIAAAVKPVLVAKHALVNAVLADKADEAAIRNAAQVLGESLGNAAVTFAGIKAQVHEKAGFTPEQMRKIAEFKAQHDAHFDAFLNEMGKLH